MQIGVPKETATGETRVAMMPEAARTLCVQGYVLQIQAGAGVAAGALDEAYQTVGCAIVDATSVRV
jgi:H+-translocating NAD(P) transhydrogenase subunit alpha